MTRATEEGADVDDVSYMIRIEDDDIIKVGSDALETLDNLIDVFYKPTKSAYFLVA